VGVKATCQDQQFYSLTYVFDSNDKQLPLLAGKSFNSTKLTLGVGWKVPAGYRCRFEILTVGNQPIDTVITLNGVPAACNSGRHCQGACTPSGAAGIAGRWAVTGVRLTP
jgi:hypothetical protein